MHGNWEMCYKWKTKKQGINEIVSTEFKLYKEEASINSGLNFCCVICTKKKSCIISKKQSKPCLSWMVDTVNDW